MNSVTDPINSKHPVIIVGCPRSGTLLTARIIGGSDRHFLITEHSNKKKNCPEDLSGIDDAVLWKKNFEYYLWDEKMKRPLVETPVYNRDRIRKIRSYYLKVSGSKRLVLKHPQHLVRIHFLKEMFPEALFVFCIRNPWHTIQSMIAKPAFPMPFLLKSFGNHVLPEDPLLRSAFSWGEAIEIYLREKDDNWVVAKYEDLVSDSKESIRNLFKALSIDDEKYFESAVNLPQKRESNFHHVKTLFEKSGYKSNIVRAIELGCKLFSYPASPDELEDSKIKYYSYVVKRKGLSIANFSKRIVHKIKNF